MPILLPFRAEHAYTRNLAVMTVGVHGTAGTFNVPALLDTGAWISVFDRALAGRIGIADITTGEPVELRVADDRVEKGYAHPVTIDALGYTLTVQIAFCPAWPEGTRNLLGMRGFFQQLRVAFDHASRKVYA